MGRHPLNTDTNNTQTKRCSKCGQTKLYEEFPRQRTSTTGRGSWCKACKNTQQKERYRSDRSDLAQRLWRAAKERAKNKKLLFTITPEDIRRILPNPFVCPVLGIPLKSGDRHLKPDSPTVDRLIPHLGYTVENINIVSHRANIIKSFGTPEEHRRVADWIEEKCAAMKGGSLSHSHPPKRSVK